MKKLRVLLFNALSVILITRNIIYFIIQFIQLIEVFNQNFYTSGLIGIPVIQFPDYIYVTKCIQVIKFIKPCLINSGNSKFPNPGGLFNEIHNHIIACFEEKLFGHFSGNHYFQCG